MSMRFSEEEARIFGLKQDARGNWYQPGREGKRCRKGSGDRIPSEVPKLQSGVCSKPKETVANKEKDEAASPDRNSGIFEETGKYLAVVISYQAKSGGGADTDNLCPKHFIDEIISSGIAPDDLTDDNFEEICATIKAIKRVKTRREQKTVVKLYRLSQ